MLALINATYNHLKVKALKRLLTTSYFRRLSHLRKCEIFQGLENSKPGEEGGGFFEAVQQTIRFDRQHIHEFPEDISLENQLLG